MNPWLSFFLGLVAGGSLGTLTLAIIVMASDRACPPNGERE